MATYGAGTFKGLDAGPGLVILAGAMTFGNEWYQTGKPNWRVPVATLLGAALIGGLSALSTNAATALGGMVVIGAATARFNGKSVIQELNGALQGSTSPPVRQAKRKVK